MTTDSKQKTSRKLETREQQAIVDLYCKLCLEPHEKTVMCMHVFGKHLLRDT